jgi:signal transduction histidine kinase
MRLGDFINSNIEPILVEWEAFAKTIEPPALTMDSKALRNHAVNMLQDMARDLGQPQTAAAQQRKSLGAGRLIDGESSAEVHAAARLFSGFTIEQLVSEYRALRASVLKMWARESKAGLATDPDDVTRFNEAVDQSVAESVARYAEMVSKSQNLFLAILGHDLRNPLATTLMASRYIMEGNDVDGKYATAANRILRASERMNRLVNDLIDYTRTNLGSDLPVILKEVDLAHLCREAVSEQALAHPDIRFELLAEGDFAGRWDDNRIAQVLSNLLGNAVQYGAADQPVILRLHAAPGHVTMQVENHGKPIPPDKINTVFEPLVRLAAERGDAPDDIGSTSLGIGLYIAREIVQAHGGTIAVTSSEQDGTVFAISLPRAPVPRVRQHRPATPH